MSGFKSSEKRRQSRLSRKVRLRKKIKGTEERPRLAIFRSSKHIYAQLIDDTSHSVICASSTCAKDFESEGSTGNVLSAKKVGETLGERAKAKGFHKVVFDKGGFRYHGRVKALADAAREAGLEF
ncbi:50S ribosomal protein L18 [PVC group bacterium (ex Bugula neritina AB1)]|nr:50S ribosomal protein L18 [PVC group bacterium (ex Bugula neritina AB1)]